MKGNWGMVPPARNLAQSIQVCKMCGTQVVGQSLMSSVKGAKPALVIFCPKCDLRG
jgi:hypothetical protein